MCYTICHNFGGGVNPRLLVIAGPLRGRTILLRSGETPVGREPANAVAISDPSLSRRHCALVRDETGYSIRDLESRNGTFVNGEAVTESRLHHGDQISVGDSVFLFLLSEEIEEPATSHVEFDEGTTHATAQLRPQDILYLQPDRVLSELPSNSRVARNLNALLKISRLVHSIRDLEQLQTQILNLIFEVAPAERGAILLDDRGSEQFASIFARHRLPHFSQPVRVSRTIARQVLEQGIAILGTDIPAAEALARSTA
jgi:FHA domain